MNGKKYFNLIEDDITSLSINKIDNFRCILMDSKGNIYEGFILAKSTKGNALTVCDINFQKSETDRKYQPRIIFRKTDDNLQTKTVRVDVKEKIISFNAGQDGYRQFWKMVAFLYKFKNLIDIGEFQDQFRVMTDEEFTKYSNNKENFGSISKAMQKVGGMGLDASAILQSALTIKLLNENKNKLEEFIKNNNNENDVQKWLDWDKYKYRQERCIIFGLEFINHKREGGVSGNRYDLLTRIGMENKERILIELKSPSDEIFDIKEIETINDSKSEYSLTSALSRAIPQILEYRNDLENKRAGDSELQKVGENEEIKIAKCIIVLGTLKNDSRWMKNFRELKRSLSSNLEIWTYTDLIRKIESTISNLEQCK